LEANEFQNARHAHRVGIPSIQKLEAETGPVVLGIPNDHGTEQRHRQQNAQIRVNGYQMPPPWAIDNDRQQGSGHQKDARVLAEHGQAKARAAKIPTPGPIFLQRYRNPQHAGQPKE